MVVCRYFASGYCRKGNACNFEHPSDQRTQNGTNNTGNSRPGVFRSGPFGSQTPAERWNLNAAEIEGDLTTTRPKWILSAYGPGKDPPAALFVDNEYSTEEVRWRYYQQAHVGNGDAADREAQQLWQKAESDMLNVARNAKDVQKFMEEKDKTHPNRYDFCKMNGTVSRDEFAKREAPSFATGTAGPNPFTKPAFGASPFGQTPNTFGQAKQPSPFGQPQQSSAFGQPAQSSAFGQPTQPSAFGRPSQPTAFGKPAFGQSSTLSQPAFGQTGFGQSNTNQAPSKFGASIQNQSPFGGSATPTTPAFGQATAFGQPAQASAFGKPAFGSTTAPAAGSPFGAGNAQNNQSPFGAANQPNNASPFGGNATQPSNASPFGGNASQPVNASPFGSANQPSNASPFGAPAQTSTSGGGFGTANTNAQQQSNPFTQSQPQQTQQAQQASPFGQAQPSTQSSNPFTQPQSQPQQPKPFGQGAFSDLQQGSGLFQSQGQQSQQASPFGQPQQPQQQASNQSPFGQQRTGGFGTQTQSTPQAAPTSSSPFAQPQQQAPALTPQASKPTDQPVWPLHYTQTLPPGQAQADRNGRLSIYRNRPVEIIETFRPSVDGVEVKDTEYPVYNRPDGKGLERIWFPKGTNEPSIQKLVRVTYDFQDIDDAYTQQVKEQYGYLFEHGNFKDHVIPLVPPERGWVDYDF